MILPAAPLVNAKQIGRTVMCALCSVLGGPEHWTDAIARPGVFTSNTDAASRRRERMKRVTAANPVLTHYRMNLPHWQGTPFVLPTPTGQTQTADNLSHFSMTPTR